MTLRKLNASTASFVEGQVVYLVPRTNSQMIQCSVERIVGDLVSLAGPGLPKKQGFSIRGDRLIPNWCEGRRMYRAAVASYLQAQELASGPAKPL